MNGINFERLFVDTVVELSKKKGIKATHLSKAAWAHNKDTATKWRKIRNGNPPQELSMRDAFDLAAALGVSMIDLCGIIQGRAVEASISSAVSQNEKDEVRQAKNITVSSIQSIKFGTATKNKQ